MKTKIVIFEDNYLMQESIKSLLELHENFEITGIYNNAKDIVRIFEQQKPDILISDIDMPGVNGLEGLKNLKSKYPDAKVLMFTVFEDNTKVVNAICLGANGYVLKSSTPEKIHSAIIDVINGGAPLTASIASVILQYFPKQYIHTTDELGSLTTKEKQVLELLTRGFSYKMIASELDKNIETVRSQIKNIYKKLNVQSNAEAIIKALKN